MLSRAYALLTVRSVDAERRVITGLATSPTPDRMGDIVEPLGVEFKNPLPLLLYHDSKQPVGLVRFKKPTAQGIEFEASIPDIASPPSLKDRVDTAWASVKAGLLKGVSIGFRSIEQAFMQETQGIRFLKSEILELSLVAVPANQDATIHTIKSLDQAHAAPGTRPISSSPGATGSPRVRSMNISEQLTAEKALLQQKSNRLQDLITAEQTNGSLETEEQTERDGLVTEVKSLTTKVGQLSALEAAQAAQAGTIALPIQRSVPAARPRAEVVNLPKGTLFTRYAMAVAAGKGSLSDTMAYAKRWQGQTPEVLEYIKATEGVAFAGSPSWGSELVNPNTLQTEFVDLLRAATIIGRVPGFRTVPFNIPIITQTGGSTFEWVGEGGSKPVGELDFTRTTMPTSKVAGIVVLTEELIRLSTPSAEETVRRDLVEQCARFLDAQFIQVGVSAGANNPASITNSVSSPAASGTDVGALLADLNTALATFDNADNNGDVVIVTTKAIARGISTLLSPLGQPAFPTMSPNGGTLLGYPVIVSNSVDAGTIVLFQPSEIFLADDGRVTLDASNQATLDMNGGSPATPTFNLWQRNCVGIRAERWIRWQKRRSDVVAVIDTAAYGPSVGSP